MTFYDTRLTKQMSPGGACRPLMPKPPILQRAPMPGQTNVSSTPPRMPSIQVSTVLTIRNQTVYCKTAKDSWRFNFVVFVVSYDPRN